jgi:hypothetical protein
VTQAWESKAGGDKDWVHSGISRLSTDTSATDKQASHHLDFFFRKKLSES